MTCRKKILAATHRNARDLIRAELTWDGCLFTNNQNLQILMFFEAFRQTAYAVVSDIGGPDIAIELLEKVTAEMRAAEGAGRGRNFDPVGFRAAQDRKLKLEDWGLFMDIPFAGEVPSDDDDEE